MESQLNTGRPSGRAMRGRILLAVLAATLLTLCSLATASALGAAQLELVARHGPTNVPLTAKVAQQYTYTVEGSEGKRPNVGRYRLFIELNEKEHHTALIKFDAPAKGVESVQEKLENINAFEGNVTVEGGPTSPTDTHWSYVITFGGAIEGQRPEVEGEDEGQSVAEEKAVEGEEIEETEFDFPEEPSRRGQRDTLVYQLVVTNVSKTPAGGPGVPITITDTLPKGLTTAETPEGSEWTCKPEGEGKTSVKCTTEHVINPDAQAPTIRLPTLVNTDKEDPDKVTEGQTLKNTVALAWEGLSTSVEDEALVSIAPVPFAINRFAAGTFGPNGEKYTVAGGHPYAATTSFYFNEVNHFNPANELVEILNPGNIKDANVVLPEGFVGNPAGGRKRCTQAEFTSGDVGGPGSAHKDPKTGEITASGCLPESQVGVANIFIKEFGEAPNRVPVYNLEPPKGVPAEFGFVVENIVPVRLDAHVARLNGKYKVTVLSADVNEAFNVNGVALTLWGTPSDSSHDIERNRENHLRTGEPSAETPKRPFLTNPVDCLQQAEHAPITILDYDSWQHIGVQNADAQPELADPSWKQVEAASPPVVGCDELVFTPKASFQPRGAAPPERPYEGGTTQASAPSGYEFNLEVPQKEELETRATPQLKDTTVTLPPGVTLSPSAANGLEACTAAQINLDSAQRGNCPAASQVGEVHITTALLEEELKGRVFVGQPECDPCTGADAEQGKLIHLYIEAEAENAGVRVKLPGNATINQATGVVTSSFTENPQVPFTTLRLTLKGGPRASLANPQLCAPYTTNILLTPWNIEGTTLTEGTTVPGGKPVSEDSSFNVDWDGAGGACPEAGLPFAPSFTAGTLNPAAGQYSEFDTVFARGDDREQYFAGEASKVGIVVQTPVGLLGKIAGVTKCEGEALEKLLKEEGDCPANSRIATATSAAGPGSDPFQASGPVYLTGAYASEVTGASGPFGLAIAVPARTKAFNLGTVVVRAAISIDKRTSAITIVADPPPLTKDGIPLRVKQIGVAVDRPEFMFNPTSCEPKAITATLTGEPAAGEARGSVTRSAPFQATDCEALPFAPKFTAAASGKTSKLNGTSFVVKVEAKPGEANIGKVEVQLPVNLPSRLSTLQEACADTVFNVNPATCPEHSVVGSATAHTPLLNSPLTGPAYLVSHANVGFPDLVFLLQGEGVHIEIVGNTDIKKGITYSKFESVPDAPINSFETNFPKGRFSILGSFGNLCELDLRAPTTIISQSNKRFEQKTPIAVSECGPTIKITKIKATAKALLVTVKTTGGGRIKIAGAGLKTTTVAGLKKGTKQIRVPLNKAGLALAHHKKKVKVTATVSAGGQKATSTAKVKA